MTHQPDTLLEAAKKTADALGLPWSDMQPLYKDLQSEDSHGSSWLPKSVGRKIWTASPKFIAKLVVAFGFSGTRLSAHDRLYLLHGLSPNGRELYSTEFPSAGHTPIAEARMAALISDPAQAAEVSAIQFDSATRSIIVVGKDQSETIFAPMSGDPWDGGDDYHRRKIMQVLTWTPAPTETSIRINGQAIVAIAESINWQFGDLPMLFGQSEEKVAG